MGIFIDIIWYAKFTQVNVKCLLILWLNLYKYIRFRIAAALFLQGATCESLKKQPKVTLKKQLLIQFYENIEIY